MKRKHDGDGGPAVEVYLNSPTGVATDGAGMITTFAGTTRWMAIV